MRHAPSSSGASILDRAIAADALGQLAGREGRMARLCTEGGSLRMDWVDAVAGLLDDDRPLVELEELAATWRAAGIRHVVWSGMGGSIVAVRVLTELGLGAHRRPDFTLHLLDSTDPAALDELIATLWQSGGLPATAADLRTLLRDVVLVAVSLGISSEEPATHLTWFVQLLEIAGLDPGRHTLVLTVAGSRLEEAAARNGVDARAVHLGGRAGIPGRMSAPATSVFLLPLALQSAGSAGQLRAVLASAWTAHDLDATVDDPWHSPYVRFAAQVAASRRLMLGLPDEWRPLHVWIEQLFEQTLGKDGKGVVVLAAQTLSRGGAGYDDLVAVDAPPIADGPAGLVTALLGWQLAVALLGYLADTNIVDEPAVEAYKSRARSLRDEHDVLDGAVQRGAIDWSSRAEGLEALVETLLRRARAGSLSYIDVTINGEVGTSARHELERRLRQLGNDTLGVPVKLRRAPAAYHVSEQCQLDGPGGVVSLRIAARTMRCASVGQYTPQFLHAQAVGAWEAMTAAGRDCELVVTDRLDEGAAVLAAVGDAVRARLAAP